MRTIPIENARVFLCAPQLPGMASFAVREMVAHNLGVANATGSGNRARRRMRAVRSKWLGLKLSELKAG